MGYGTVVCVDDSFDTDRALEAGSDRLRTDGRVNVVTAFHPEPRGQSAAPSPRTRRA